MGRLRWHLQVLTYPEDRESAERGPSKLESGEIERVLAKNKSIARTGDFSHSHFTSRQFDLCALCAPPPGRSGGEPAGNSVEPVLQPRTSMEQMS